MYHNHNELDDERKKLRNDSVALYKIDFNRVYAVNQLIPHKLCHYFMLYATIKFIINDCQ